MDCKVEEKNKRKPGRVHSQDLAQHGDQVQVPGGHQPDSEMLAAQRRGKLQSLRFMLSIR